MVETGAGWVRDGFLEEVMHSCAEESARLGLFLAGDTDWSKVWTPEAEAICCYWSRGGRRGSWGQRLGPADGGSYVSGQGFRTIVY